MNPGKSWAALIVAAAWLVGTGANAQEHKASEITRPAGVAPFSAPAGELLALGEKLFLDEKLSTNKMSCNTCHAGLQQYNESFKAAYPHRMGMGVDMFGVEKVSAEQAVQLCMLVPMEAKTLDWKSRELAALTAYVLKVQKDFMAKK